MVHQALSRRGIGVCFSCIIEECNHDISTACLDRPKALFDAPSCPHPMLNDTTVLSLPSVVVPGPIGVGFCDAEHIASRYLMTRMVPVQNSQYFPTPMRRSFPISAGGYRTLPCASISSSSFGTVGSYPSVDALRETAVYLPSYTQAPCPCTDQLLLPPSSAYTVVSIPSVGFIASLS
jgi:hypothetical protein